MQKAAAGYDALDTTLVCLPSSLLCRHGLASNKLLPIPWQTKVLLYCVCVCVCVCRDSFGLRQSYLTVSLTTVIVQVNVQSSCDFNMYVMAS